MANGNGMKIGIALGAHEMVGVVLGKKGSPSTRTSLSLESDSSETRAELVRAFGEVKNGLEKARGGGTDGASVHVTLLPPLADARLVPFPPMRKSEVEAVLGRDVARYFLGANRPRVVGVRLPRMAGNGPGPARETTMAVLAAASPIGFLETVRSAVQSVGWGVSSFSAAHGAWLASASAGKGDPAVGVVAILGETAHVMGLAGGDPVAVRQVPSSEPVSIVKALGVEEGPVLVLADVQPFEGLRSVLAEAGFRAYRDPEGWPGAQEGTAGRAGSADLQLLPPTLARERAERVRKTTLGLVVGAAVLVLASLGAQFWGAQRELRSVQSQRAAIRSEVAPLILARDSLNGMETRVRSLLDLSRSQSRWTRTLVELTALLPSDTYLTGLFASGDTVEIEAAGARAGEAIQTLREAGLFEELRLQGIVERELDEGETVEERFRLWARLPPVGGEGGGS